MRKLQTRPSRERMEKIATVLQKIDDDHDGVVEVDDVLQVSCSLSSVVTMLGI